MKQIIVNVDGLTTEEKQRVNEALAKIKHIKVCNTQRWDEITVMYGPSLLGAIVGYDCYRHKTSSPTHTPQQVLEMAGIAKQGHLHSENMALYAEDAKTHAEPWELWQVKCGEGEWYACRSNPRWDPFRGYRRKPKTHFVHGVGIPDLRIKVFNEEDLDGDCIGYCVDPLNVELHLEHCLVDPETTKRFLELGILYELTEEGKQAAILHTKIMLGIAGQ